MDAPLHPLVGRFPPLHARPVRAAPSAPHPLTKRDRPAVSQRTGSHLPVTETLNPPSATDDTDDRRNRLVIALLLVSAFVVILNETIMGVALPALERSLGITTATGQWLTTGFMLTMAVVIPITGFLIQRLHTRTLFLTAMTLFTAGTAISAAAPGFEVLLAGRIVQASGTAVMMPLLMTTVLTLVPAERRGRTMGNISIVMSVAPALGPTISGIILNALEWRWMFIVMLPLAVGALILGAVRMQNVTEPRPGKVDVLSVILSAIGFSALIYGLSSIGEAAAHGGVAVVPPAAPIVIGAASLAVFAWRQFSLAKADRALLDLRVFRSGNFTISLVMLLISMMALFGTLIVLPLYLQQVLLLNPLNAGLVLLPGGIVMALLSPFVGRLYDRFGPRALLLTGSITVSGVLWAMTLLSETTPVWVVPIGHSALSVGLAFLFTPLFTSALGSVEPRLYSHGSAVVSTLQQVAAGAGTALFVTMLTIVTAGATSSAGLEQAGLAETAEGMRAAFFCGGVISLLAIALAFFVRKPANEVPSQGGH